MNAVSKFAFGDGFQNHQHEVRVITLDGQPWFVAADVCRCLGLDLMVDGTQKYLTRLNADEKRVVSRRDPSTCNLFTGTRGRTNTPKQIWGERRGPSSLTLISESGLYKLVMRSDKAQVKAFQDWVTRDVLPAIRKDGSYVMGEEKVASGEMV